MCVKSTDVSLFIGSHDAEEEAVQHTELLSRRSKSCLHGNMLSWIMFDSNINHPYETACKGLYSQSRHAVYIIKHTLLLITFT